MGNFTHVPTSLAPYHPGRLDFFPVDRGQRWTHNASTPGPGGCARGGSSSPVWLVDLRRSCTGRPLRTPMRSHAHRGRSVAVPGASPNGLHAARRLRSAAANAASRSERCIPKRTPCCGGGLKPCGKRCIARNKCCKHTDCGARRLCANGTCIIGQGTCAAGANACGGVNPSTACNRTPDTVCYCLETTTGQTRCGRNPFLGTCAACLGDADCVRNHPDVPGVFCVQATGNCACSGTTVCVAPCTE